MSIPSRLLSDPRNARSADGAPLCCEDQLAVPLWRLLTFFPSQGPQIRALLIAQGADADALWCPRCSTGLEDLRDALADAGPGILRLFATVAAFVPGAGSGVAFALGAAASLAEGNSVSDAMVDAAFAAIPAGQQARIGLDAAAETSAALLDGVDVDDAFLRGAREAARSAGGDGAAVAFDGVLAIVQGRTLQDAGFAGLKAFVRGNAIAERGAEYAGKIARAAREGRELAELLVTELRSELVKSAGASARRLVGPVVDRLTWDPVLRRMGSGALGMLLDVPEPVARAGQAIVRSGAVDSELLEELTRPAVVSMIDEYGPAVIASRALNLSWSEVAALNRSEMLELALRMDPAALSYATARAQADPAALVVGASVPAGTAGDLALGGAVVAACAALVWWARSA